MMEDVIAYGEHPLQTIKVFHFDPSIQKTYVFIHGGAWRDINNTYDDFKPMIDYFLDNDNINAIGINYRLSPEFKHPVHLIDIVSAMNFIADQFTKKIIVVGHSVGATLILQLFDFKKIIQLGIQSLEGNDYSFELTSRIQQDMIELSNQLKIRTVYLIDGIYDIVELASEYEDYSSFINDAFVSVDHYKHSTPVSNKLLKLDNMDEATRIVVVQSVQDELLSLKQTNLLVDYFQENNIKYELIVDKFGKHEQVYKNLELAQIILAKK